MIFVDSNVPIYLVGTAHPNRDVLERFLRERTDEVFVSSAEIYQEIIHRYIAIDRRAAIADAFALLDGLLVETFDVTRADIDAAHDVALRQRKLSGCDCLHVAVMARHGIPRILTMDRGFDHWPGVERLPGD